MIMENTETLMEEAKKLIYEPIDYNLLTDYRRQVFKIPVGSISDDEIKNFISSFKLKQNEFKG